MIARKLVIIHVSMFIHQWIRFTWSSMKCFILLLVAVFMRKILRSKAFLIIPILLSPCKQYEIRQKFQHIPPTERENYSTTYFCPFNFIWRNSTLFFCHLGRWTRLHFSLAAFLLKKPNLYNNTISCASSIECVRLFIYRNWSRSFNKNHMSCIKLNRID